MLRRLVPSPSMFVALVALFVALGGSAYAAIVITGRNIRNSTVEGADIKNGALASRDIKANSVGGVAILESRLGTVPSASQADGLTRFAVVSGAGALARGRSVSSAARTSAGRYQVIFDRDVRGCAYFATIGDTSAAGPPQGSEITTSSLASNVNGISIRTENDAGAAVDRPFHLVVPC
jgi:hypothetical protein